MVICTAAASRFSSRYHWIFYVVLKGAKGASLESFQDFLIELDMKPPMHLVEISIFSLNNVTVRPTKIMNRADKNWAHF